MDYETTDDCYEEGMPTYLITLSYMLDPNYIAAISFPHVLPILAMDDNSLVAR